MSEIEPTARTVLKHHYPEVPLHGDFTTIKAGEYPGIDVLVGGTPCQSFSVAGLRGGMADARGNLALGYLRLADRLRPGWLVWENVPGVLSSAGGRDFGAFIGGMAELGYGWAYRVLDAQYFGLAQRRKRVFVVGCLGDWRRAASVLFEPASLRGNPAPRRETWERTAASLTRGADSGGKGGYAGRRREDDENLIAPPITSNPYGDHESREGLLVANPLGAKRDGGWRGDLDNETYVARSLNAHGRRMDGESETFVTHSLHFDATEDGTGYGTPIIPIDMRQASRGIKITNVRSSGSGGAPGHGIGEDGDPAYTVSERGQAVAFQHRASHHNSMNTSAISPFLDVGKGPAAIAFQTSQSGTREHETHATLDANNGSRRHNGAMVGQTVRRLTPVECLRLQGFPDNYFDGVLYRGKPIADGPRYRLLGNSMAVPVMAWIGKRIAVANGT